MAARAADAPELPVVFRFDPDCGEVVALFPTLPHDFRGTHTAYVRVGQHHAASWPVVIEQTRPARPNEYAALLSELRGIYERHNPVFELRVYRRRTAKHREEFRRELRRIQCGPGGVA